MPRPTQRRRQRAADEGGRGSSNVEPQGYRLVLHNWKRKPAIGEVVQALLKSQTRAVRAEVVAVEADGRWRVRPLAEEGAAEEVVPLGRLTPTYRDGPEPVVVCVDDTHGFRRLARLQVESGDKVVEVGCSYGDTTELMARPGDCELLGLDISDECVRHCAGLQLPRARFEWFDALGSRTALRQLLDLERPDLLVVDINGRRALADVVELVEGAMRGAAAEAAAPRPTGG